MADVTRKPKKQASVRQKAKKSSKNKRPRPGARTKGGGQNPPRSDKELAKEAIRRKKAEMEAEETAQEPVEEVEAEPVEGTLEQVLEGQDSGEQQLLEDMALEFWLRTRSLAMVADLMNRSKSTVQGYVTRARQRRRGEVMASDMAQAVADVLSEWEFVQKMAMEEFLSAPPGSFQRNGFLHTYMQAIGRKEHTLRQAALLPRAPKENDFDFGRERQSLSTVAQRVEQMSEEARQSAMRVRLHGILKQLRGGSKAEILGGGEGG